MLRHELLTHHMRRVNDLSQPWRGKRSKFSLGSYMETEEGLASLHAAMGGDGDLGPPPFLFSAALHYMAAYLAPRCSFPELFRLLSRYIDDERRCWLQCVRAKRGGCRAPAAADAGERNEGGLGNKDQVYFSGALKILRARKSIDLCVARPGRGLGLGLGLGLGDDTAF